MSGTNDVDVVDVEISENSENGAEELPKKTVPEDAGNLPQKRENTDGRYRQINEDVELQEMVDGVALPQKEEIFERPLYRPAHHPQSISWRWPIIFLAAGCLLYYLVHLNDYVLPNVVSRHDAEEDTSLFSGERSKDSLIKLTNLGPRVVGHFANEVQTPELIESEVKDAMGNAHPSQKIYIERQKGSGAYQLGFIPSFTNIYENVQNVLVKIEGSDGRHGILVNCHYDTVPEVQGASDDGISCAVMLELIRVLSKAPERLEHNVIFLFNGAEEVPLQGSHLFLQHKWSQNTRIVLNLEAAGLGGRSILFQSGPQNAWIFNYYAKYAPHPHGQVSAEELFQGGYIPSDTDFRIFRDYGKMPGLDFAFSRNGHVYHTIYDNERFITAGSHQHMGDNTLALIKSIGNAAELYDMEANAAGQVVYYDYMGWFMISYSAGAGIALNIIVILLAVFSIVIFVGRLMKWKWLPESTPIVGKTYEKLTFQAFISKFKPNKETSQESTVSEDYIGVYKQSDNTLRKQGTSAVLLEISIAIAARLAGMGAAIAVTAIVALIVDAAAPLAMPWYSNIWLIFPLYWCPCLLVFGLIPHLVDVYRSPKHKLELNTRAQMNLIAAQIPWIFVFFFMTCTGSRSACVFFLPTLFSTIANFVIFLTPLYQTNYTWIWVYFGIHLPAVLMNMYTVMLGYVAFLPVMARSGQINGDLSIAVLSSFFCVFLTSFAVPFMTLVRRPGVVFAALGGFSIFMIIVSLTSSIGHPYSSGPGSPSPQRYWIMHTSREFRNEFDEVRRDSGYFVLNLDRNSPKTIPIWGRSEIRSLNEDCDQEQYCGLPLYMTRMVPLSRGSSWIKANQPVQPYLTQLNVRNKTCSNLRCTFNFDLEGPDRMTLTFAPREGASLVEWSIPSEIQPSGEWKGQPSYYLHIVQGTLRPFYPIRLTFSVTKEQEEGQRFLDIGLAGNHVHFEDKRTKDFQDFLDSLPEWVMRTGWISAYKSYIL